MLISTRGRYALRAVIDLAEHREEGRIPLKEIAARQDVSEKYLESILKILVKDKIITGMRGKGGGYRLEIDPNELTVHRILLATEGSLSPVEGIEEYHSDLPQYSQYKILQMWRELDEQIESFFKTRTVNDLIDESNGADYYVI